LTPINLGPVERQRPPHSAVSFSAARPVLSILIIGVGLYVGYHDWIGLAQRDLKVVAAG
jgi:hypothetical protein